MRYRQCRPRKAFSLISRSARQMRMHRAGAVGPRGARRLRIGNAGCDFAPTLAGQDNNVLASLSVQAACTAPSTARWPLFTQRCVSIVAARNRSTCTMLRVGLHGLDRFVDEGSPLRRAVLLVEMRDRTARDCQCQRSFFIPFAFCYFDTTS
ncbi:hypothetical protein IE81DRAFT_85414 [Ceraceosorus guamensis]|uniref:Uncharacterized protein n=1 Tax=Ceraceosorus guamensis TaxID=1522189 RepID=A0A316WC01_9BASI|nr:hypothetical protein IE81DRAFT_85414 [Ceraceosorus guamensis]PWN46161.1 hypothetical protein IE81DRAFT_85414 [Ceraceosorus guamensis]